MQVATVGLDLAKNVFHVHGIADSGEVVFSRPLRRAQVLTFFERLDRCLIGMEACGTSHHWARELMRLGHDVRADPAHLREALCEAWESISKMGDRYIRRLLVLGMTSRIRHIRSQPAAFDPWFSQILSRKPAKLAAVAMANKTARIIWAVLTREEPYRVRTI